MKRTLLSHLTALVIICLASAPTLTAVAQTPAASRTATPDPFVLPANHRIVRIREGNGFEYLRLHQAGIAYADGDLVDEGLSTVPVPPSLEQWYTALQMEDMYFSYAIMVPEGENGVAGAIAVDIRLMSFEDGDAAGVMVPASVGVLIQQAGVSPTASRDLALIDDVPDHDEAIIGITGTDPAVDTRPPVRAPFSRFIAQHGTIVASVKVSGADEALNDAVARELLAAQLACLEERGVCVPVPLPAGTADQPGTAVASPVAHRSTTCTRRR